MATVPREWEVDEETAAHDELYYEGYADVGSVYPYTAVPDPMEYHREVRSRVHHAPRPTPRHLPPQVRI